MKTYTTFELELDDLYQFRWSGSVIFYVYKNGEYIDTFNDFGITHISDARERVLQYLFEDGILEDPYVYSFEGFKK